MMTCPICGNKFNDLEAEILDNGNPACLKCVKKEEAKKTTSKNQTGSNENKKEGK